MRNCIGGKQRVLVLLVDGKICSQAVKVDCGVHGFCGEMWILRQHSRYDAGKDVSAASLRHTGVSSGVDGNGTVRMGDESTPSFQNERDMFFHRKFTSQ